MASLLTICGTGWRLVAAALLFIVSAHAAAPLGAPLERLAGSAFSASTAEVSLGGKRDRLARPALSESRSPNPLAGPVAAIIAAGPRDPLPIAPLAAPPHDRFDATGPPLRQLTRASLGSRAPPTA